MKALYILIAIALIGVGYYWYQSMGIDSNEVEVMPDETAEIEPANDDGEAATVEAEVTVNSTTSVDSQVETETEANVKVFSLSGSNYEYDVTEITVTEGDTVTINFTSVEGFHDWVVDELAVATDRISAGSTTSVTFVADQAGTYEFYCSVGSHRELGMVGTITVEPAV